MPCISVTRLHLRSWRFLPQFVWHGSRSRRQAETAIGNLGVLTQKTQGLSFWTLTAWEDEAAMYRYMRSGAHRQAMPVLVEMCDEAASIHWSQPTADLPNWQQAAEQLQSQGHLIKVKYPSAAYTTGQINVH